MPEAIAGADIIPFPPRSSVSADAGADPSERLRRALEVLENALTEQRVAVANLRTGITDLRSSMSKLGDNVGAYRDRLATLKDQVGQMQMQTHTLADRAGMMAHLSEAAQPSAQTPDDDSNA